MRLALCVLSCAAGLGARAAEAAPPACFPTRYVGEATSLVGDRIFGTLAPGQMVTLLEDQLPVDLSGFHYTFARVELVSPVQIKALAVPRQLEVFLRRDVPIEPGASWWMAGAAMRVIASDDGRFEIGRPGSNRESAVAVGCDDLVADPPGGKAKGRNEDCDACKPEPPLPKRAAAGPVVCWEKQEFEVIVPGPSASKIVIEAREGTLVRWEGERVLVEIIDDFQPLRLWRWLPASALKPRCKPYGVGSISLCDLGGGVDKGLHGAVLAGPAPLLPAPGEPPLTILRGGTRVVWDKEQDGLRRVLIRWPNEDWSGEWRLQLVGFIPSASLRRAPAPRRAKWHVEMPNWARPFPPPSADAGATPGR